MLVVAAFYPPADCTAERPVGETAQQGIGMQTGTRSMRVCKRPGDRLCQLALYWTREQQAYSGGTPDVRL